MTPTHEDYYETALCLWREARGEGVTGMTAVACVVRNRAEKHGISFAAVVLQRLQFTSMTDQNDPEYKLYPEGDDAMWPEAKQIAQEIIDGALDDVTGRATLYWNPKGIVSSKFVLVPGGQVKFPQTWNAAVVEVTKVIGKHVFAREL